MYNHTATRVYAIDCVVWLKAAISPLQYLHTPSDLQVCRPDASSAVCQLGKKGTFNRKSSTSLVEVNLYRAQKGNAVLASFARRLFFFFC